MLFRSGDRAEPLLAGRVPQLDGDVAVVHADGLHLEVDTKRGAQVGHEDPLGDPVDEGGLANRRVSRKHNFVGSVRRSGRLQISQFAVVLRSFSVIGESTLVLNYPSVTLPIMLRIRYNKSERLRTSSAPKQRTLLTGLEHKNHEMIITTF